MRSSNSLLAKLGMMSLPRAPGVSDMRAFVQDGVDMRAFVQDRVIKPVLESATMMGKISAVRPAPENTKADETLLLLIKRLNSIVSPAVQNGHAHPKDEAGIHESSPSSMFSR